MHSKDKIRVLIVDDETTLTMIIKETLEEKEAFEVFMAENGEIGLQKFHSLSPDIVIADIMMPRIDGFEMVQLIRQSDENVPILMLSARSAVSDVVKGFEIGCNDYLKKPFGMNELIVRIKSLLKRSHVSKSQSIVFEIGRYKFDSITQNLLLDLWGDDSIFNGRSLHVFITKLRKRLSYDSDVQILNVRGLGYKLVVLPSANT